MMLKERLNDLSVENNFAKWLPSEEKIKEFAAKTHMGKCIIEVSQSIN